MERTCCYGEHSSKDCHRPDTPEKELSSLVGSGRDGNQSGIGLANIELFGCKPLAQMCFACYIRRRLESWYRPQHILVPSQHEPRNHTLCSHSL